MRVSIHIIGFFILFTFCQAPVPCSGQLGIPFDIKKPRQYEDRVLGSEKTDQKKFNAPRRFIQNTVTRYNYFFNANNKLNEIIDRAKQQHQDNFTELLPFYNYSLEVTSQNRNDLDSIISKSTTGIVLHDLRGDWVDNLYLLIGAAYYLRKDFDSAFLTFQFINYAFAPKEKDGYYRTIGSRLDGNQAFSISTKEKTSLPKKVFSEPPSRNDAFIWQIRTFIAREQFAEAASLIVTLKNDPLFPKRLMKDLNEVQALWFYRQNSFDSAAVYLERALDNAPTKSERARWEYLTGQLYETSHLDADAKRMYEKVISHTTDPVMEMYARLNAIKTNTDGGEHDIDKNISELLKMAKKDKYTDYRDIIFFTVAQMELDKGDIKEAMAALLKSTAYKSNTGDLRNKAFIQLGEMAFAQKKYRQASTFYDSIDVNDRYLKDPEMIMKRRDDLRLIAENIDILQRQDSLQHLAGMTEEDRKDFVRKLARQLRRQQGLKEEDLTRPPASSDPNSSDIFSGNTVKGDWYFYNSSLRSKGAGAFKTRWGNRPNVDNWRRSSAASLFAKDGGAVTKQAEDVMTSQNTAGEITYDALYNNIPLSPEQMVKSNDSVSSALFVLGKAYAEKIEDCSSSIDTLESLREKFPGSPDMEETLFLLYYCYTKSGMNAKADSARKELGEKYTTGSFNRKLNNPGMDVSRVNQNHPELNRIYEEIYTLFIEGRFEEALAKKKQTEAVYRNNYWTPQLLYIEAVYHIKQREDSAGIHALESLIALHKDSVLAEKATDLLNVVKRRKEIEDELNSLTIERPADESRADTLTNVLVVNPAGAPPGQDSAVAKLPPEDKVMPPADKPADTSGKKPVDKPLLATAYSYRPDEACFAVIVLNKVDNIWGNETKNAFNRYNREKYNSLKLEINQVQPDEENKILLIGRFENAQAAADYAAQAKKLAPSQIVPWLTASKYSFTIISSSNLDILMSKKDITEYKAFINQYFPDKF